MNELDIIEMYERGLSIEYITNKLYKYLKKESKETVYDGHQVVRKKYTKTECRCLVLEVLMKWI